MPIKIATAQYPIRYHASWDAWKNYMEQWIREATEKQAALLLFPEYGAMELVSIFPTDVQQDIQWQLQELQTIYPAFCRFFGEMADRYSVIICAPSFPVAAGQHIYNRTHVFAPKGHTGFQDKFFMTRFEDETWGIHTPPKVLTLFDAGWCRFGVQTCYDVEFALGARWLCEAGAELILAPSCTETLRGATRVHVGARARALENQCYTAVSQTVGEALWSPAVDINFGYAAVYTTPDQDFPEEGILLSGEPQAEQWLFAELDFDKIKNVRENGQVLNFRSNASLSYQYKEEEVQLQTVRLY